jgi:hypothetical protein
MRTRKVKLRLRSKNEVAILIAARRTPHAARRTPHAARRTPHAARRTPH